MAPISRKYREGGGKAGRGRGAGRVSAANWGIWGGGGLIFFFFGAEISTKVKNKAILQGNLHRNAHSKLQKRAKTHLEFRVGGLRGPKVLGAEIIRVLYLYLSPGC